MQLTTRKHIHKDTNRFPPPTVGGEGGCGPTALRDTRYSCVLSGWKPIQSRRAFEVIALRSCSTRTQRMSQCWTQSQAVRAHRTKHRLADRRGLEIEGRPPNAIMAREAAVFQVHRMGLGGGWGAGAGAYREAQPAQPRLQYPAAAAGSSWPWGRSQIRWERR